MKTILKEVNIYEYDELKNVDKQRALYEAIDWYVESYK